jgi:hypothetical protein
MAKDIPAGGICTTRESDGLYRIVKVLVLDEHVVRLRSFATRFKAR